CVWLEIGRPLRAVNVFVHLKRSWMSRESVAAVALFLLGAGLIAGLRWRAWPTAVAALVFLYCQARILGAARGIPAWRAPLTVPLLVATALAEGVGLFAVVASWTQPPATFAWALAALAIVRSLLWFAWRLAL